jgi:hypothetical protein
MSAFCNTLHSATQAMPVQSAILLPEPGSVIDGSQVSAVWFRGYAWGGDGLPITRVDVSADGGATWATASIVEREGGGQGPDTAADPNAPPQVGSRAWSWVKWQLPLQVCVRVQISSLFAAKHATYTQSFLNRCSLQHIMCRAVRPTSHHAASPVASTCVSRPQC